MSWESYYAQRDTANENRRLKQIRHDLGCGIGKELEAIAQINRDRKFWKLKLFQILRCFDLCEGTWFEFEWESFGITEEERKQIKKEYNLWHDNLTSSLHVRNQAESETGSDA